jgi:protoporphyrinogen oxidase
MKKKKNKFYNILVGFGLSGLGFIENFKKPIKIYEKNSTSGGHCKSTSYRGYYFDEGAHISHTKNIFFKKKFFKKNKLIKIDNPNVVNFKNNKVIGYPVNLSLSSLSLLEKFNVLFDYLRLIFFKKKINNFEDWCRINFGETLYKNYFKKYTLKYWRTHPQKLSHLNWAKKRIVSGNYFKSLMSIFLNFQNKNMAYATFYYPKKFGFYNFFEEKFSEYKINKNSEVTKIFPNQKKIIIKKKEIYYKKIFSTIPLPEYLSLFNKIPPNIKKEIKNLKYTSTICINFVVKKRMNIDYHWCYFYDNHIEASRMTIISNIVKNDKKDYQGQIEIFRRNDEKYLVDDLIKNSKKMIINFFKLENEKDIKILFHKIYKYSYPVPLRSNKINIIHKWLNSKKIYPFGLYGNWKYMWSDESYMNGKLNAQKYSK